MLPAMKDFQEVTRRNVLSLLRNLENCYLIQCADSAVDHMVPNLHIFTDASKSAYRACAYLETENTSRLIMAKNRVAPIKPTALPRLELMGEVVGAKLVKYLNGILNVKSTTL